MEDLLIELLESLGFDVIKQGTLEQETETPNAFFTYWNWDSPRTVHYDNSHYQVDYYYQLQFYSNDVKIVDETLNKAIELLENNGFELESEPIDGYSDLPTYISKSLDVHIKKEVS